MSSQYRVERWKDANAPDPETLRKILVSEGYSVYRWIDTPDTVYDSHFHDSDQSHWIISGSLELTIDGERSFVLKAGDRDFMPAGTNHSARVVGNEPVVYLIAEK